MSTQAQLSLFSPIKVNLYLRIVSKRPDGYHDLETVMVPLDFGDTLTFSPAGTGIAMTCDNPTLPTDDTNLVLRAAKKLAARFDVKQGALIHLAKKAPLAAGVGGGSSNAALTLLGLNQLWKLNATTEQLGEIAASLGSDINFFLAGSAALCHGRGEQVEAIPCRLKAHILLINPGFGISTKWAYESWAKAAAGLTAAAPAVSVLTRALAEGDLRAVCDGLYNSLEAPSVGKFPVLELLKRTMRQEGADGALMSGSGATVFGLFADKSAAERAGAKVRAEFGPSMWTHVCQFAAR